MQKVKFTKEQKILHHLVLHANDMPQIGLFNGKMGIVLVLARYAGIRKLPSIEMASDFLMEKIMDNLTKTAPQDFAHGLAGVGWGIEYLLQNGYMKGCGADICEEIDKRLMERDIRRMNDLSLETGIEGLLHYVTAHLQGAKACNMKVFDADYLNDWQTRLTSCKASGIISPEFERLITQFEETLQGKPTSYPFELKSFIKQAKTYHNHKTDSGLHSGTAGRLELLLEGGKL